jgi:glutamate/aspartate transport system substrate-binding protein
VLAFCLLGIAHPIHASIDTVKKLRETKSITLGYREAALPFSYTDEQGKPIGYAVDLCVRTVARMKARLALSDLTIKWQPVTSANRIPLVTKGSVDLECGSTSNTAERQKRVAFGPTYFVSRLAIAVSAKLPITEFVQAAGQAVASATGTTSVIAIKRFEESRGVDFKDFFLRDHQQAFDALAAGRAVAVVLDDVLLAGFIAASSSPEAYRLLGEFLGAEGYGAMLRNDDPGFKALVTETFSELMASGEAEQLYEKWFTQPIPPKGINFQLPLSPELKALFQRPSSDPLKP